MDRFRLESHLGSGAFGAVQLVRDVTSGRQLAVKCIKRIHASKYLEEEILNHSLLRHPHIIHFREVSGPRCTTRAAHGRGHVLGGVRACVRCSGAWLAAFGRSGPLLLRAVTQHQSGNNGLHMFAGLSYGR